LIDGCHRGVFEPIHSLRSFEELAYNKALRTGR
jgi:hypothetical protein